MMELLSVIALTTHSSLIFSKIVLDLHLCLFSDVFVMLPYISISLHDDIFSFLCMKFSRNDLTRILCQSFESSAFSEDSDRRQPALLCLKPYIRLPFSWFWQPPILPCRLQHSTFGRLGLNRRVRDVYGCSPKPHRHQKLFVILVSSP
jgi:hypothetical protein